MLKIGEFSKLSQLTVKALRHYEKEGLLLPAHVDPWTGYRQYQTSQLVDAARIKSLRQLGLSIDQVRSILRGENPWSILLQKERELREQQADLSMRLSIIRNLLKEERMTYQVTIKEIPETLVYSAEATLESYSDAMTWIPRVGAEAKRLNPDLRCTEPPYEFCEYLDGEYREHDVRIRHSEAVMESGKENELITFRTIPATRVLSILHRGPYDQLGEAYAFLMEYAESNGYVCADLARECYIDGIWNKDNVADWLTEIQLPIQ
ncbi:MAG: MerR family transcriptional regulator [Eggerthellales bacterium]|nr:MerR family transcriptional regulator [Eggerthellales bacterium]